MSRNVTSNGREFVATWRTTTTQQIGANKLTRTTSKDNQSAKTRTGCRSGNVDNRGK
jgi:hypothetical protein